MKLSDKDKYIIERYQQDEAMMVLIFAQWCINHDLDPLEVYERAYPNQPKNKLLLEAIEKTVPKNESEDISKEVVQHVLQLFGNDDLAFVIEEIMESKQ